MGFPWVVPEVGAVVFVAEVGFHLLQARFPVLRSRKPLAQLPAMMTRSWKSEQQLKDAAIIIARLALPSSTPTGGDQLEAENLEQATAWLDAWRSGIDPELLLRQASAFLVKVQAADKFLQNMSPTLVTDLRAWLAKNN